MTTVARRTRADLITDARARGVIGFRCEECGYRHRSVHMIGRPCNAAHPDADNHDGEPCGSWNLSEIRNPGDELTVTRAKAGLC